MTASRPRQLALVAAAVEAFAADQLLELGDTLPQRLQLAVGVFRRPAGEERIVAPPIQAHLLGRVGRGDEEAQLEREQFDVEDVHDDVAGDDDALVEHPLEHVGERVRLPAQRPGPDAADAADGRFGAHESTEPRLNRRRRS